MLPDQVRHMEGLVPELRDLLLMALAGMPDTIVRDQAVAFMLGQAPAEVRALRNLYPFSIINMPG